jgi:7-keto-8-aminopelargonate synthetase-like enzyme
VTESLFSMDGDLAPLADLHDVCTKHEAFLYVDEAHAYGVLGPDGKGACAAAGIKADDPHVIRMGTLGKSFGSYGAFIAAAPELVELLTSRSRGFIFTTGIPPAAAAAAEAALAVSLAEPHRRTDLLHRAGALRTVLAAQGWETGASAAQIVPLLLHDAELTMQASRELLDAGVYCQGIRPPTVPAGTCRLRVSLTAAHGEAQLAQLARAFGDLAPMREEAARRARG